ncbi:MAG: hypothetical protein HY706_19595 [Candidatus Hydrogenedentes bacterium]|nr:hypothetical protein [Candidatus Hydrogenedentota bacterium]
MISFHRCLIALLGAILISASESEEPKPSAAPLVPPVLVTTIAGISVGKADMHDSDVTDRFGPGYYVEAGGHCGGRYYTNPKQTLTFYIELGVDRIVDMVEITEGLHIPVEIDVDSIARIIYRGGRERAWAIPKDLPLPKAVTPKLGDSVEIDAGLELGMSPDELLRILGPPTSDKTTDEQHTIRYETNYEKDPRVRLDYSATFTFTKGRLTGLNLYDGE